MRDEDGEDKEDDDVDEESEESEDSDESERYEDRGEEKRGHVADTTSLYTNTVEAQGCRRKACVLSPSSSSLIQGTCLPGRSLYFMQHQPIALLSGGLRGADTKAKPT